MKRTIFIHIPRVAGTSMQKNANQNAESFQILSAKFFRPQDKFTCMSHRSPKLFLKKKVFTQEWWNSSFKFAFVRNPWDRIVSLYEYLQKFRPHRRERNSNAFLETFPKFIASVTSCEMVFVHSVSSRNVKDFSQANSQIEWLKWGVDFVGRFENIDADWKRLCNIVGMKYVPLMNLHKTKNRKHYREYYDSNTKKMVHDFYLQDINRFNYEF